MRGVVRLVIIVEVAANTGIGGAVIVVAMAVVTIVHRSMGAFQDIIVIMIREKSRFPAWVCSVTGGAFSRQVQ
jgi:hypothetical protein